MGVRGNRKNKSLEDDVFYVKPEILEKAMNGELVGIGGCPIPSWKSLKGLTISKINKIKDNLRTTNETEDLLNQSFFGYCYCVRKCLDENVSPPILNFTNYYSSWLATGLLRYIKKEAWLVKTPYLEKDRMKIGDNESNLVALAKAEFESATNEDENVVYMKELVSNILDTLDSEERQFVELFYGLNKDEEKHSLTKICEIMNIKRQKINNISQSSMFKMRDYCIKNNIDINDIKL